MALQRVLTKRIYLVPAGIPRLNFWQLVTVPQPPHHLLSVFTSLIATAPPRCPQPMKILLLTLSEYGQANSILALATELGQRSDLDVHVGTFAPLEKRVNSIRSRSKSPVTFHTLRGSTYGEAAVKKGLNAITFPHPPSNKSNKALHMIGPVLVPWTDEEYLRLIQEVEQIVNSLEADTVVIDTLFSPAVDACRLSGRRYMLSSPNQTLDLVRMSQPRLRGFWYYPA